MAYTYALNPFTKKLDIVGTVTPPDTSPGGALNIWLMENGLDGWLLEDGSGFWLLEA